MQEAASYQCFQRAGHYPSRFIHAPGPVANTVIQMRVVIIDDEMLQRQILRH